MKPSSRTPEGEPLECRLCGGSSVVESATPPGDTVCPSCGAHSWIAAAPSGAGRAQTAIRAYVRELQTLVTANHSPQYTVGFFVRGLRRCLAAHGASLWIAQKRWPWTNPKPFLVRSDGQSACSKFASEVIAKRTTLVRQESAASPTFLHLGVPVLWEKRVIGAIEIAQRDVRDESVQHGYIQFIRQMAEVATPCAAMLRPSPQS